jgi:glycine oxidase
MPTDVVSHIIDTHLGYVVPRLDGRMVVGATVEDAGFEKRVTDEAIEHLLHGAQRIVPALKDAKVRETWAGLRPRSADDLPILGPVVDCDGLIVATGHFRNGILLAPITAQLVTEWITDQPTSIEVGKFSPNRFA